MATAANIKDVHLEWEQMQNVRAYVRRTGTLWESLNPGEAPKPDVKHASLNKETLFPLASLLHAGGSEIHMVRIPDLCSEIFDSKELFSFGFGLALAFI